MTQKPLPFTKDGYRYSWGEDDEPLCSRYLEALAAVEPNKRINFPSFVKRKLIPTSVKLSEHDRAPQLKINEDFNEVTGEKGYSMVRATHGINRGKFYFEVYIKSMPENTAARLGWSQYYSNLQAPLGYDHYGYSWRSRFGTKFHVAKGKTFDQSGGYRAKDTIGCMIELPFGNHRNLTYADHLPMSIKQSGYMINAKKRDIVLRTLEERDEPPEEKKMKPLIGSKISFYKNGRLIGVAFEDIYEGFYYPSISLYKQCSVKTNFGPEFKFPPEKYNENSKVHLNYQPASDMAEIAIIDNLLSDMLYILDREIDIDGVNTLDIDVKKSLQV